MKIHRITLLCTALLLSGLAACVYAEPPRRAYRYVDHDRGRDSDHDRRVYGSEHLFDTARNIERLAGHLESRATEDKHHSRIRDEDLDRIEHVNQAAEKFWDQVKKYHGDLSHVDEEYRSLVHRMIEAERVIGYFSGDVQADYNQLWGMVQDLSYIQGEEERKQWERRH